MNRFTSIAILGFAIVAASTSVHAGSKSRTQMEGSSPVQVIDADELELQGSRDIADALQQVTPAQAFGNCNNYNGVKLRGLNPLTIGANDQYGTSASTRNNVEGQAKGMAMGALNSVMGGSGISFGGGGGDGASSGPKTYKDPTSGGYAHLDYNGFDLGVRANFVGDKLTISQKIFDSPDGNSTFHSTWLQNNDGKIIQPTGYFIYQLYTDHKLTIWWTYDHWTNGVHDDHDEGEESYSWRTYEGLRFEKMFGGEEGLKNSIWYQSGFDTAVKGVKVLGTEYALAPEDMMGGCPLTLNTHLTLPSMDPVKTFAMPASLYIDPGLKLDGLKYSDIPVTVEPFDWSKLDYGQ